MEILDRIMVSTITTLIRGMYILATIWAYIVFFGLAALILGGLGWLLYHFL